MNMALIIAAVCTLVAFILIMGIVALLRSGKEEANDKVKARLRQFALNEVETESIDLLLKQSSMSEVPFFNRMLENLKFASNLTRTIKQADAKGSPGIYLLLCALLAMVGGYGGYILSDRLFVGMVLAFMLGNSPLWYLKRKKAKRMDRFQQQLPDALDLMSRALKAGHTFSGGMRMVADEFENPLGEEFRITLEEINFGMDVDRALLNLQERVDVTDLKFFIVSVNIQRETGGNLSEIISNIARLVRERFILYGKVRILSAEGRISAILLSALPFAISGVLYLINPDYISLLWTHDLGRTMAWSAITSMVMGVAIMRRMVNIKV